MNTQELQQLIQSIFYLQGKRYWDDIKELMIIKEDVEYMNCVLRATFATRWFLLPRWSDYLEETKQEMIKQGHPWATTLAGLHGTTERGRMLEWPKGALNSIRLGFPHK